MQFIILCPHLTSLDEEFAMAINAARAKKLCTASELELVQASSLRTRRELTEKQLQSRAKLARKLRDKYHVLAEKQARAAVKKTAGKAAASKNDNQSALAKEAMFAEVLERFESRLMELQPTPQVVALAATLPRQPKKDSPAKPVKAPKKGAPTPTPELAARKTRRKTEAKQARRKEVEAAYVRGGTKAVAGHISARGRRRQAARDQRN
jgi:hypothetical protein